MMNVLVCLASQFSKELVNVDAFSKMPAPVEPGMPATSEQLPTRLSTVLSPAILKLAK